MPGNILAVDTGFPELNQGSPEEKISALAGYVYQLLEQLRYTLNNLGQDNFNDTELKGLEKLFTGPLTVRVEISPVSGKRWRGFKSVQKPRTMWEYRRFPECPFIF